MIVQNNFSVLRTNFQPNMEVSVNGYIFVIAEILPTETGKGKQYKGVLTLPDGTQKSFMDKPVFVTKLNEYAGAKGTKVATKKETSQTSGTNKVVSITNLSETKIEEALHVEHKKAVKAYYKLLDALDIDATFGASRELYHVFMNELKKTQADTRKRLEDKLAQQREKLSVAKKAEAERIKKARIARLQSYIANYDTYVGKVFIEGNMEKAMKLRLTKDERIIRAGMLLDILFAS